ncbi:MAG: riboflavin biosynthesis protein RibF, partial [Desulfobacterales bacterium]
FPTANLYITGDDLVPRYGVYVCQVIYEETCYGGVINIGYNPTFDGGVLVAEAHIFDFNKDIYGKPITVNLIKYLREEVKFTGVASLARYIAKDVERSRKILAALAGKQGDLP